MKYAVRDGTRYDRAGMEGMWHPAAPEGETCRWEYRQVGRIPEECGNAAAQPIRPKSPSSVVRRNSKIARSRGSTIQRRTRAEAGWSGRA